MKPVWVIRGTGFDRTIALRLDSIHTGSLFVKVDDGERKILIDSIHKIVHVPEGQGGLYVGGGAMIGGLAGMIYGAATKSNDGWGDSLRPYGYMMAGILSGAAVGSLIEIHLTAPRAYNMMHDSYEQKVSVLSTWIR